MGPVNWNEYSVCFCLLWYYLSFGIFVLSELIQTELKGEVNSLIKGAMDNKDKFNSRCKSPECNDATMPMSCFPTCFLDATVVKIQVVKMFPNWKNEWNLTVS